jgi:hypothetical protein
MEQNRQLMEQIKSLRPSLAKQDGSVQPTPAQNPPSPSQSGPASPQAAGQTDAQDQTKEDDSSLLPEASNGNPAIFGEFNPGRGFTVA